MTSWRTAGWEPVRRVVVHDGHQGPKEIGVGPEFLRFLTDPDAERRGCPV